MRHRRGTPGLTPYRLRTIEAGYPRRRRPARHLRRGRLPTARSAAGAVISSLRSGRLVNGGRGLPPPHPGVASRRRPARRTVSAQRRMAGSQVAMGLAGLVTLGLLIVGGYQAAAGAAVVLGMF